MNISPWKDEEMSLHASDRAYGRTRQKARNTGLLVGIVVAAALLAIGYLVFSANGDIELRGPVEKLNGGQILSVDTSSFIVRMQDGACINLARMSPRYFWYTETDCPDL